MTGELRDPVDRNPRARSLNKGPPVAKKAVEDEIYEWIVDLRKKDIPVTTLLIIIKALALDGAFHSDNFADCVVERFATDGTLSRVSGSDFVNMDETAVFFETKPNQTVNKKGEKTIAIRCFDSNAKQITICVACASDGTKLPLMFVFKGRPGGKIEQNIHEGLPDGTFGCCGDKGWMDERSCRIWFEKIWLPHVASTDESLLLLDEFKYHMQKTFVNKPADIGTEVEFIPGGYTSTRQPCDVGANRPLKKRIREQCTQWAVTRLKDVEKSANVAAPTRKEVCLWAKKAWDAVSPDSIRRTFGHIGYQKNCEEQNANIEADDSLHEMVEDNDVLIF